MTYTSDKPEGSRLLAATLSAIADKALDAPSLARTSAKAGSIMGRALADALGGGDSAGAYDQPRAFEVFIRGGGNLALYAAVSAALARSYDTHRPASLLDIGAGDGMALGPALAESAHAPSRVNVVEPHEALLERLLSSLPMARGRLATLQAFVASMPGGERWNLAQATFALQSIEPEARQRALAELAPRIDRLVLIEFDVPRLVSGSPGYYASLAARYETAASEYGGDAGLVAGGFLAPMLLGQLRSSVPSNYEQPAASWVSELEGAGYRVVAQSHVHDYSWAPAFLLEAEPLPRRIVDLSACNDPPAQAAVFVPARRASLVPPIEATRAG